MTDLSNQGRKGAGEAACIVAKFSRISLEYTSDKSDRVRTIRVPRFIFAGVVFACILGICLPLILVGLSPRYAGIIEISLRDPLKEQILSLQEKTAELTLELNELRETARNIRTLAGIEEFESELPFLQDSQEMPDVIANVRDGLPFIVDEDRTVTIDTGVDEDRTVKIRHIPSIWPTVGWVTRGFQHGGGPVTPAHHGLDLAAREGTPVLATADGVVTFADWDQDLGWLVEINHGYGLVTRYGHNSGLRVDSGQPVRRGQIIAVVGNTGRSTAPHLHYEVWNGNTSVDPRDYLPEVIQWVDLLASARTSS